jgi:hypothetical protein
MAFGSPNISPRYRNMHGALQAEYCLYKSNHPEFMSLTIRNSDHIAQAFKGEISQ